MLINEGDKLLYKGELVEVVRLLPALAWLGKEDGYMFEVNFIDLMQNSEQTDAEDFAGVYDKRIWIKRRQDLGHVDDHDFEIETTGDGVAFELRWLHTEGHSYEIELTKEETRQVRDYLNDALENWEG